MLFSVIIPTYNRSHCIGRALASVASQGVNDLEIVIGDDASTDDTVETILQIVPSVRIARLEVNHGAATARNVAMMIATGEFLAFLDSDDEWLPGKLTSQLEYLRSHPECAVCGSGHFLETKDGLRVDFPGVNPPDWRRELHMAQSFHGASTPLVRRSVLESVGLQDEELRVLEDWDWMLRISQHHTIHVLPEMLAVIHENNPSDADQTLLAMQHFLAKHCEEFIAYDLSHARHVISQHQENAARALIRHGRLTEGGRMLCRSWMNAPLRNPLIPAAFPLLAIDLLTGSNLLADLLTRRNRLQLRSR